MNGDLDEEFCSCCGSQQFEAFLAATAATRSRAAGLTCSPCSGDVGAEGLKATTKRGKDIHGSMFGASGNEAAAETESGTPLTDAFYKAWDGDASYSAVAKFFAKTQQFDLGTGFNVMSFAAFGNVNVLEYEDGLVMIDTALSILAPQVIKAVREFSDKPVTHCIYTHGHRDHASYEGLHELDEDCLKRTGQKTSVIGHKNLASRFDRYKLTPGYNAYINNRYSGKSHRNLTFHSFPLRYNHNDN